MFFAKWRNEINDLFETRGVRLVFKILLLPIFILIKLFSFVSRKKLLLDHLEIVVGSQCTLHCRKCANLMQYYRHPTVFDAGRIEEDVHKLLALDIQIDRVNVIGGEPFLYKELPRLIALLQNSAKVRTIRIITNGTFLPPNPILEALKSSKVHVFISNYIGIGVKTNEVYQFLKNAGVNVFISTVTWFNYHHQFSGYHRSADELKRIYRNCHMACHELLNGEIHLCPTSAHGMYLGLIPRDENSFVSIRHNGSKKEKRETVRKLRHLLTQQVPNACDFCSGDHGEIIPVAEQLPPGTYLDAAGAVCGKASGCSDNVETGENERKGA